MKNWSKATNKRKIHLLHAKFIEALDEYVYLYNCIWQFTISDYVAGCSDKGFDYMVGRAVASK